MLINAQYMDGDALTNYIPALEGGLRESGSSRSKGSSSSGRGHGLTCTIRPHEQRRESSHQMQLPLLEHR